MVSLILLGMLQLFLSTIWPISFHVGVLLSLKEIKLESLMKAMSS